VDKYDSVSPKHRWGPYRMSYAAAGAKLGGLVKGRFKGIKVLDRGSSPRIVTAAVIGSRGRTRVDGATLRARFGLYDSWIYFTAIKTRPAPPPPESDPESGGVTPVVARVPAIAGLRGQVLPARKRSRLTVQRRTGGRWVAVERVATGRAGHYAVGLPATGLYRVSYRGDAGPAVRVR
jgi:stage II sporulation protein D